MVSSHSLQCSVPAKLNSIETGFRQCLRYSILEIVIMLIALYYTGILPLSYQIDLRKLRFYRAKYTAASVGSMHRLYCMAFNNRYQQSVQLTYLWLNTVFSILLQMPSILEQFGPSLLICYFSGVFMFMLLFFLGSGVCLCVCFFPCYLLVKDIIIY